MNDKTTTAAKAKLPDAGAAQAGPLTHMPAAELATSTGDDGAFKGGTYHEAGLNGPTAGQTYDYEAERRRDNERHIRLECLKIAAVETGRGGTATKRAEAYVDWVMTGTAPP